MIAQAVLPADHDTSAMGIINLTKFSLLIKGIQLFIGNQLNSILLKLGKESKARSIKTDSLVPKTVKPPRRY